MNVIFKDVLLLKSKTESTNDKYELLLKKNGFNVKYLQILQFDYINLNELKEKLNNVDKYDGVIFTSPRAVNAMKLCLNDKEIDERWKNKVNYVVGESTYELVNKELGIICKGKESGNANNLADLIIKDSTVKDYKQFLFPCGNLKKETLGNCLKNNNILLDALTVYETAKSSNLSEDFTQITSNLQNIPEYIVYFSPSGVKFTTNTFKEAKVPFSGLKLIAIGPSTEEAIKNESLNVYAVAEKPTETDLLNAILKNSK